MRVKEKKHFRADLELQFQICTKGKEPTLYFYRDSSQHEVDLLLQRGFQYEGYEIKSSQTFTREFLGGLHYLGKLLGERLTRSAVIYSGAEQLETSHDAVINFREFKL